jgi:hypothetical protein
VGCGRQAPKRELVRLALSGGSQLVIDRAQRLPGRGAYVCSDPCLDRAGSRGGLQRAFRSSAALDLQNVESIG